jgi:hypothetical protein
MQSSGWRNLRGVEPRMLSEARVNAHYALQWLARAARVYLPQEPDDSHTNLGWSDSIRGLETHRLQDGSRIGLNIADFALVFSGAGEGARRVACSVRGRTEAQLRFWMREQITAKGLNPNSLDAGSPYPMPPHPIGRGGEYGAGVTDEAFGELADWFANAEMALGAARAQIAAMELPAPGPRCWPHHFDLATLTSFPAGASSQTAFVGAGFSPGDHYYDEPYFYVSLYPALDRAQLPQLAALGYWHTHEFTAAIATAGTINSVRDPQAGVEEFLKVAIDSAVALLKARA